MKTIGTALQHFHATPGFGRLLSMIITIHDWSHKAAESAATRVLPVAMGRSSRLNCGNPLATSSILPISWSSTGLMLRATLYLPRVIFQHARLGGTGPIWQTSIVTRGVDRTFAILPGAATNLGTQATGMTFYTTSLLSHRDPMDDSKHPWVMNRASLANR